MIKEVFVQKASKVQKQQYDYSKVPLEFSTRDKVCIICPKHGEFYQRVDIHTSGKGCPKCGHERTGESCRKSNLDVKNQAKFEIQFPIIENPKIPEKQYIIGTIYLFINKINNKVYVGQTYNSYLCRWTAHRNAQDTFYFHTALKKYTWDNFNKYILEQTESYLNTEDNIKIVNDWLNSREKYYIQLFNSNNKKYGYNLTVGGKDVYPNFEQTNNSSKKSHGKKVEQYDLEGNLVKVWSSVKEIYTTTEFKRDGISDCSNGLRDSYKGYRWKIIDTKKDIKYNSITAPKPVLQYDIDGNFIKRFDSGEAVKKELGIDSHLVRGCCNKVYNTSKGFIWIFEQEGKIQNKLPLEELESRNLDKRLVQKDLSGKILNVWIDATQAAVSLNLNSSLINSCARGHSRTSQGFIWERTTLRELNDYYNKTIKD